MHNAGTSALALTGIALTGGGASSFDFTTNCPASLAADADCSINVIFKPVAIGAKGALLAFQTARRERRARSR